MRGARSCVACIFAFFLASFGAYGQENLLTVAKSSETGPEEVKHLAPSETWASFAVTPSVWYTFIERSGPLFTDKKPQSIGTQAGNLNGPFAGITASISPKVGWFSDGFLAGTSFSFSAYFAGTNGNYSAQYYKNPTNTQPDDWWGSAHESRQDYEILAVRKMDDVFGEFGALKFVAGARYLNIDTTAYGHDMFNQTLTYQRTNHYLLGESGFRLEAPLRENWYLFLGGTGLYGTTFNQNEDVCGCNNKEPNTGTTQAYGYDVFGGIRADFLYGDPDGFDLRNFSASLRFRDRSLYIDELGKLGIDHEYGPEFSITWRSEYTRHPE